MNPLKTWASCFRRAFRFFALYTLAVFSGAASAQDLSNHEITLGLAWTNFKAPNNGNKKLFSELGRLYGAGYRYIPDKWWSLDVPFRFGAADFPVYSDVLGKVTGYRKDISYLGLDAIGHYHIYRGGFLCPSLYAGIGGVLREKRNFNIQFPAGVEMVFKITRRFSLYVQADYRFSVKAGFDNWQFASGLIGKPVCRYPDTDKDGFHDDEDLCPGVFGTVVGCPDTDGDGVADKDDLCARIPGVESNSGCPADADKDGVYDAEDDCPELAGTVRGCPDRDHDGVTDREDFCPDIYGTMKNKGCPAPRDRDRDGVADQEDLCPDLPGPVSGKGCPEKPEVPSETPQIALLPVLFESGSAVVPESSLGNLEGAYLVLVRFPEMKMSIQGHSDDRGDVRANQVLSENRARACAEYLVKKGISFSRLNVQGSGSVEPAGDNKTAEGRKLNRRVEFIPVMR